MGNSCTSIFPDTRLWEQQEWNKIKKQTKKVRREAWVWNDGLSLPNQNTILINLIWYYSTRYGKLHNEIQLTKKNGFEQSKNYQSFTLPRAYRVVPISKLDGWKHTTAFLKSSETNLQQTLIHLRQYWCYGNRSVIGNRWGKSIFRNWGNRPDPSRQENYPDEETAVTSLWDGGGGGFAEHQLVSIEI